MNVNEASLLVFNKEPKITQIFFVPFSPPIKGRHRRHTLDVVGHACMLPAKLFAIVRFFPCLPSSRLASTRRRWGETVHAVEIILCAPISILLSEKSWIRSIIVVALETFLKFLHCKVFVGRADEHLVEWCVRACAFVARFILRSFRLSSSMSPAQLVYMGGREGCPQLRCRQLTTIHSSQQPYRYHFSLVLYLFIPLMIFVTFYSLCIHCHSWLTFREFVLFFHIFTINLSIFSVLCSSHISSTRSCHQWIS